jgi:curved DNA-binding protein CbpA
MPELPPDSPFDPLADTAAGEDPATVLGVAPEAGAEEIRAAYLRLIRQYPPDRAPEQFQRIRAAYEVLSDPAQRARRMLLQDDPFKPLTRLLQGRESGRRFVGPGPWLEVLKP